MGAADERVTTGDAELEAQAVACVNAFVRGYLLTDSRCRRTLPRTGNPKAFGRAAAQGGCDGRRE